MDYRFHSDNNMRAFLRKAWKPVLGFLWCALLIGVVYHLFDGNWLVIGKAMTQANPYLLVCMVVAGLGWYLVDAITFRHLYRMQHAEITFFQSFRMSIISSFGDVLTMGSGTKPFQLWYSYQIGISPGMTMGVTLIPYALQKVMAVVLTIPLFLLQYSFVREHFSSTIAYLYLGMLGSIGIALLLVLLCTLPMIQKLIMRILRKILQNPKYEDSLEKIDGQLSSMLEAGQFLFRHKKTALLVILGVTVKLLIFYHLPIMALYAAYGSFLGLTYLQLLCMTAITKLVMGVIPTSGGVGSLEVVFALIFAGLLGEAAAGTTMVLFRIANYYLPFVTSCIVLAGLIFERRKQNK